MNNTIFDDVFRTMIEKMPYLAVPLINEVFHTSYSEDVKITQLRNEHQQEDGEIITDSCLLIGKKMYHIECQSTDDTTMAVRMIEYDFAIAVRFLDFPPVQHFLTVLKSREFAERVEKLGGYGLARTGEILYL